MKTKLLYNILSVTLSLPFYASLRPGAIKNNMIALVETRRFFFSPINLLKVQLTLEIIPVQLTLMTSIS